MPPVVLLVLFPCAPPNEKPPVGADPAPAWLPNEKDGVDDPDVFFALGFAPAPPPKRFVGGFDDGVVEPPKEKPLGFPPKENPPEADQLACRRHTHGG